MIMSKVIYIQDSEGNNVLPVTSTSAVLNSNGESVEVIVEGINEHIDEAVFAAENTVNMLDAEKERAENIEAGINERLTQVEAIAEISIGGGDAQIATSATEIVSGSAKIPTTGAVNGALLSTGYFECSTAAATAAKTVSATGYALRVGGSMKIKMTNANTANDATLNIQSTGAKPLYYDGQRASATNSWEAGETVEVYYDGTSFYANNVAGGSGSVEVANSTSESDLDFSDEEGNVLVRFAGGHLQVKNFSSADALESIQAILSNIGFDNVPEFDEEADYAVGDIVRYGKYVYVFTSAHTAGEWDDTEVEETILTSESQVEVIDSESEADLDVSDEDDNVLVRFVEGHIKTKNFDSQDVNILERALDSEMGNKNGVTSTALTYNYISLLNSASEKDGKITQIEIKTEESGNTIFAIAMWDETHGFIDIKEQFSLAVESGINSLSINKNVPKDYQLFVIGGIKPIETNASKHIIAGNENIGDSDNNIIERQTSCYLSWTVHYDAVTVKQGFEMMSSDINTISEEVTTCNDKVSNLMIVLT